MAHQRGKGRSFRLHGKNKGWSLRLRRVSRAIPKASGDASLTFAGSMQEAERGGCAYSRLSAGSTSRLYRQARIETLVWRLIAMTADTAENFFSTWKLDRSSGVLLHVQIERLLHDLISRSPYSAGALLPDELTMASRLGVSRGTVRESILNLVHQGFLERRKGVGTRVVQTGLVAWSSLTGEMRRKGIDVESFLLKVTEKTAKGRIADALQVPVGTPVKCLDQIRGWDDRPVLQSRSWFHPRLNLSGKEDFRRPLYELLKAETGIVVDNARKSFWRLRPTGQLRAVFRSKRERPCCSGVGLVRLPRPSNRIRRNSLRHRRYFADVNLSCQADVGRKSSTRALKLLKHSRTVEVTDPEPVKRVLNFLVAGFGHKQSREENY